MYTVGIDVPSGRKIDSQCHGANVEMNSKPCNSALTRYTRIGSNTEEPLLVLSGPSRPRRWRVRIVPRSRGGSGTVSVRSYLSSFFIKQPNLSLHGCGRIETDLSHKGSLAGPGLTRLRCPHRLDKETSWVRRTRCQ